MSAGRYSVILYSVILSRGAKRAIEHDLPEAVAAAVVHFLYGPLADDPHRVGMPLRFQLEGYWSARRGQYRVIYSIDDDEVVAAPSASLTAPTSTADTSTVHQFGKGSRLRM